MKSIILEIDKATVGRFNSELAKGLTKEELCRIAREVHYDLFESRTFCEHLDGAIEDACERVLKERKNANLA